MTLSQGQTELLPPHDFFFNSTSLSLKRKRRKEAVLKENREELWPPLRSLSPEHPRHPRLEGGAPAGVRTWLLEAALCYWRPGARGAPPAWSSGPRGLTHQRPGGPAPRQQGSSSGTTWLPRALRRKLSKQLKIRLAKQRFFQLNERPSADQTLLQTPAAPSVPALLLG